jgi:hypothetical protein
MARISVQSRRQWEHVADGNQVTGIPRSPAWWLRSAFALALVIAILALALPVAFGGGAWNGGVDPTQFF